MFDLNSFELGAFQKQKRYTQVLYQDSIMLVLQIIIFSNILKVPEVLTENEFQGTSLMGSFWTTVISIINFWYVLWAESRGLREHVTDYILLSMIAKQNWLPYGNKLKSCQIGQDIDFSMIEIKLPFITNTLGIQTSHIYQFTQESLSKLGSYLDQAHAIR